MGRDRGWPAVVGGMLALTLVGCSEGGDEADVSDKPSPVDVSDDGLCPFLTGEEREELTLTVVSRSGSTSTPHSERAKERERERAKRLLDECRYRGPMVGSGPIQQMSAQLWEGSVAELTEVMPKYRLHKDMKRDGIISESGMAFNKTTAVCSFLAPGKPAAGGEPATTVEVTAFVTVVSTKDWEHRDSCDALDEKAPLIMEKFHTD